MRQEVTVSESVDKEEQKQQKGKNDGPQDKIIGPFTDQSAKKGYTVLFLCNRVQLIGGVLQFCIKVLYLCLVTGNGCGKVFDALVRRIDGITDRTI